MDILTWNFRDNHHYLPLSTIPPHVLVKRHVPPSPHFLVQHLTLLGSLGQKPVWIVPPDAEQALVGRQIPGVLPTLHAPLIAAWAVVRATARTSIWRCIIGLLSGMSPRWKMNERVCRSRSLIYCSAESIFKFRSFGCILFHLSSPSTTVHHKYKWMSLFLTKLYFKGAQCINRVPPCDSLCGKKDHHL